METINYKDNNGKIINVSVIGFFRIPELEKEFIMYGLIDDDNSNDSGHVLLGEVIRENETNFKILGIKSSEKDMVLAYYNEISQQMGGNGNG